MGNNRDYIAALLRERETCEQRGLDDRVKAIDTQLKVLGGEARAPKNRAEKRPSARSGQEAR